MHMVWDVCASLKCQVGEVSLTQRFQTTSWEHLGCCPGASCPPQSCFCNVALPACSAIPWSRSLGAPVSNANHSVSDAMSMIMGAPLDSGYLNQLMEQNFPESGYIQCSASGALSSADSLKILGLAGIFIIQAIFALCSVILFLALKLKSRRVRAQAAEVVSKVHKPLSRTLQGTWPRPLRYSSASAALYSGEQRLHSVMGGPGSMSVKGIDQGVCL